MKQEVTALQHRLLKQLAVTEAGATLSGLKPRPKAATLQPLVRNEWISELKKGRFKVLTLTDAGKEWISRNPEFVLEKEPFTVPQRLFLMDLMLMGGSAAAADFSPPPPAAKDRKPLIDAKLLAESPAPKRSVSFLLTDAGWKWAEDHLADSYKTPGPAARVLQRALGKLGAFLAANEFRLADFVRTRPGKRLNEPDRINGDQTLDIIHTNAPAHDQLPRDIEAAIQSACLQLGEGADRRRLRLADVRRLLPEFDRQMQDSALLDLSLAQSLVLYGMDDPKEIKPEDKAAELRTPGGEPRHIVYWIGSRIGK